MNEALQKALLEILNGAAAGLTAAKDFLTAEIPEVAQQLLMWKLFDNLFVAFACCLVILGTVWLATKSAGHLHKANVQEAIFWNSTGAEERAARAARDNHQGYTFIFGIPAVIGAMVSIIVALPVLVDRIRDALQIWVAPKLYLIEYAADLAQKVAK